MTLTELLADPAFGVRVDPRHVPTGFLADRFDASRPLYSDQTRGGTVARALYSALENLQAAASGAAAPDALLRSRLVWVEVYTLADLVSETGRAGDTGAAYTGERAARVGGHATRDWLAYCASRGWTGPDVDGWRQEYSGT